MNIYVMYSGATDVTGEAIKQSLKAEGGQELPKKTYDIFIGWGAKTKGAVKIQAKHILNHPDNIRSNRNKFEALKKLSKAGITVGNFVEAKKSSLLKWSSLFSIPVSIDVVSTDALKVLNVF